jgi:hypothetical protein
MMTVYCHRCGKKQPESAHFCFECGASLVSTDLLATEAEYRPNLGVTPDPSTVDSANFDMIRAVVSPHPWRRYFAHFIDLLVFGTAGSFAVGLLLAAIFPNSSGDWIALFENPIVAILLVYLCAIPIEAALLSSTGTTLGKGVFGIKLSHNTGRLLSFAEALQRGCYRWFQAEALGVPILVLIANYFAYNTLTQKGITRYDEALSVNVTHTQWGPVRASIAIVVTLLTFFLASYLNSFNP